MSSGEIPSGATRHYRDLFFEFQVCYSPQAHSETINERKLNNRLRIEVKKNE